MYQAACKLLGPRGRVAPAFLDVALAATRRQRPAATDVSNGGSACHQLTAQSTSQPTSQLTTLNDNIKEHQVSLSLPLLDWFANSSHQLVTRCSKALVLKRLRHCSMTFSSTIRLCLSSGPRHRSGAWRRLQGKWMPLAILGLHGN